MGFFSSFDEAKILEENLQLKTKVDELQLEISKLKKQISDTTCYFVMNNSPLDNIKVASKLVLVDVKCDMKTKDNLPYNRIVGMVGDKYTIFNKEGKSVNVGLVDSLDEVIKYAKNSNYIVCEY